MKQIFLKAWLILACLLVGVGETWGETSTYQHVFTAKPSTGDGITLSGMQWNISATNLNGYNSANYAGVQFGTSSKVGAISLTSKNAWSYNGKTKITEIRLWLNQGGGTTTPSCTIGGKTATKSGSVTKNSAAAADWTKTSKISFTPASDGNEGVVVISVSSTAAGYICALEIDCEGDPTKTTPTLSFEAPTYNATVGETFTAPELTNPDGVAVTYASSQTSVATVNATSGEVALVAPGETKITASFAGDATRNPASASYKLIVAENIADKTIAEFIASGGGKCYLTGVVSNIKNTTYGNFDLTDESGTIYVYGCLDADKQKGKFSTLDVVEGDKIKVLAESYEYYQNTTHEAKDVIFVEEIPYEKPKYTVTIEDAMNGTLTVKEGANVLTSGDEVELGKTLTIECSPNDGYRYEGWYYKEDGDWVTMTDVMTHVVTKDITITASFGEIPAYTVAWSVNGEVVDSKVYAEGATVTAPENPSDINGKVFTGWVASEIDGVVNDVPTYVTPTTATADVTYYAVFATYNSDAREDEWQTTALSALTSSDVFVMAREKDAISTANGTSGSPSAVLLTVSDGKITSVVTDDLKWTLTGNETDGYTFYANGTTNYLYVNTTATSGSNTCIRVGKQNSNVRNNWKPDADGYLKTNDTYTARYLSYYGAASDFRGYTNTNNNPFAPTFYKFIPGEPAYSDFCTTVPTPVEPTYTPEVLALVAQNEEGYYATYSSSEVTFWPEDYVVSAVGVEAGTLYKFDNDDAFDQGTVEIESESVKGYYVPANTGVLVYSLEALASYYTVTGVTPSNDVAAVNMLVPTTSTTCPVVAGDNLYYKLAYGDFESKTKLGFWWGAEDGSGMFNVKAGGAVLVVPAAAGSVRGFSFDGEDTTGIESLAGANEAQSTIYNLQGVRMQKLVRGVNIMNGRKVLR